MQRRRRYLSVGGRCYIQYCCSHKSKCFLCCFLVHQANIQQRCSTASRRRRRGDPWSYRCSSSSWPPGSSCGNVRSVGNRPKSVRQNVHPGATQQTKMKRRRKQQTKNQTKHDRETTAHAQCQEKGNRALKTAKWLR